MAYDLSQGCRWITPTQIIEGDGVRRCVIEDTTNPGNYYAICFRVTAGTLGPCASDSLGPFATEAEATAVLGSVPAPA